MRTSAVLLALCALGFSACDSPTSSNKPSGLRLSRPEVTLNDADSLRITASFLDSKGAVITNPPSALDVTWSVADSRIATVLNGMISALHPGQTYVYATAGKLRDSALVIVKPVPAQLVGFTGLDQSSHPEAGLPESVAVRVIDRHGNGVPGVTVTFAVSSGGGTVNADGGVTDAQGVARAFWVLGPKTGENTVVAIADALPGASVTIRATALPQIMFISANFLRFVTLGLSEVTGIPAAQYLEGATWSPDGRRIAFAGKVPDRTGTAIFVINRDGTERVQITDPGIDHSDADPTWSPDGKWIAFTAFRGAPGGRIHVVRPDGTGLAQVVDVAGITPAWAPDSKRIAFSSSQPGEQAEISTVDLDGRNLTRLTHNTVHDSGPAWSPDGTRIVFGSFLGGVQFHLYIMKADGSDLRQLTSTPYLDEHPSWSPDGKSIAFARTLEPHQTRTGIFSVNPDGTGVRELWTSEGAPMKHPEWRP